MRDIDHARLVLGRLIGVREIVDIIMKPIATVVNASIKVQTYGRGLLARFRDHRLSYRNFVPALRLQARAFTGIDMVSEGWNHEDLIQPDMSGYNAIRRTRANRRSLRRLFNINNGFLGIGKYVAMERSLQRSDRMSDRGQARFRWMLSSRDLSGNPLIQN